MGDPAAYDELGRGYAHHRRPDPVIEAMIADALGGARTVLNVGAGAGSYEPAGREVVAVEPSRVMLGQRPPGSPSAVAATAEALPFAPATFDAAMAVLTIHHWRDPWAGLGEMRRVARRQVVLTFDPDAHGTHWLTDYIPELADVFRATPDVAAVRDALAARHVRVVPVAHDTPDGMTIAYWRRPHAYLDPAVRAAGSALQRVESGALDRGLRRLAADLASGAWHRRYGNLLAADSMDYGLRLVAT